METPRVLSGHALVAKGITKIDASLPEVGLKDVAPNGSWLEQKQIQAALEARKYLIEVERIEKCGTLSHAEWRDDLMLAEVTQKVGGYWQYLGHNVGKTLYLQPEEALFLMEVNCLLLKHNEVTVSLQKAYSLLLQPPTTLIQYKVYASLSRLGYKVFRHKCPKANDVKNYCSKLGRLSELRNIDSPITSTDCESENVDSPSAFTIKSDYLDSPSISTGNDSENTNSPVVPNKSEEIQSTAVNVSENVDSPAVENKEVMENISSQTVNTNSDLKNIPLPLEDAVVASENIVLPKGTTDENKNVSSEIELNDDKEKVSEDIGLEIADSNIEMSDDRNSDQNIANNNGKDSLAKANNTPNVVEMDETINYKIANNNNETIGEVSSTVTEIVETNSMEICSENLEAVSSDLTEINECDRNKDLELPASVEVTSLTSDVVMDSVSEVISDDTNKDIRSDMVVQMAVDAVLHTGTNNIEDNGKSLEDKTHKDQNGENTQNNCTSTEKLSQKYYPQDYTDYNYLRKIDKITKRQIRPSDSKTLEEHFKNVPDCSKECVVTVNVPDQQFIPKNIFVHNSNYVLNLENIKRRSIRSASSDAASYTSSDEVNGANIRRIRSSSSTEFPQNPTFFSNMRLPRTSHFRPYGFWRPQNNMNFYQLMSFINFQPRVQFHQRPHPLLRPSSFHFNPHNPNISNNARKRMRSGKTAHFQGIRNLSIRLKQSLISGNTDMRNLESLQALLHSYNLRYKTRLRLTDNFDVINEEKIVETIELDDDEESKSKKPRLEKEENKFDENMYRLKQLASRLRDLETKDKATASHRRAFSKAIKTFNKSYNADVYLDEDSYEIIDRRCITLDSSSESDCIVEEEPEANKKKGKRLRNPFNILKRRSERLKSQNNPGTSKTNTVISKAISERVIAEEDRIKYYEHLHEVFNETWLPNENDFGRAEIVSKVYMNFRLMHTNKEQYLYDFMKDHLRHENWAEAKISFLKYLEESNIAFKNEQARILADSDFCDSGLKPLIDFDDSSDMPLVLEKLRIISSNKDINSETSLSIDFDVYNRDVQNFKKRNPPKPHFRIICVDISSGFPSATDIMALHSKYEDSVAIVFAIVDTGSISYLQINPIDLPVYVPNSDVV